MVCTPWAAVLGSRTRVDPYNRSITKPLTGEPDAGDPPVRFGGRGKVQSLVPTPIMDEGSDVNDAMVLEGVYGSQYPSTGKALHRDYQLLASLADHAEELAWAAYRLYTGQEPDIDT